MYAFSVRYRRRGAPYLPWLLILALGVIVGGMLIGRTAAVAADEVECSSIRLEMESEGYDQSCATDNSANVTYESLEASAIDGTHFLVIGDAKVNFRYIFRGGDSLRKTLTDSFDFLNVQGWRSGKGQQGLTTSEFTSDYKTIPSACVGFQGYYGKEPGGWRRHIIGFGCSRVGNTSQVYDALRHVNFPD